jgi:hypothetical protein
MKKIYVDEIISKKEDNPVPTVYSIDAHPNISCCVKSVSKKPKL